MIRFRPLVVQSLFALGAFVWLCWLGFWQLDRLAWKLELIEISQQRAFGEPVALAPVLARSAIEDMRYQKIAVTGRYDHDAEVFVYAPHRQGQGFRVITPFFPKVGASEAGTPVLVDRGWVPGVQRAADQRRDGQPEGTITLEGLIIFGGEGTLGVAGKQDGDPVWMYRDLAGMADYLKLSPVAPVFVVALTELTPEVGAEVASQPEQQVWPRHEAPDLEFRNNHLSYAVTWFGLAFALVSVYIAFHISIGRLRFGSSKKDLPT